MGTYDEDSAETSEKHLEIEPRINTRRKSVDSNISGKTVYILSKHFQKCLDFEMCKILQSFLLIYFVENCNSLGRVLQPQQIAEVM